MKKLMAIMFLAVFLTGFSVAQQEPAHPLSHISPIDVDLEMDGQSITQVENMRMQNGIEIDGYTILTHPDGDGNIDILRYNEPEGQWEVRNANLNMQGNDIATGGGNVAIRDSSTNEDLIRFEEGGEVQVVAQNLDLNDGDLSNFFGSPCESGEAVVDINSDGTYQCTDLSEDVEDVYVNREGDSMLGNLDMAGNSLIDTEGSVTLGSGDVSIPSGGLDVSGNILGERGNIMTSAGNMVLEAQGSGTDITMLDSQGTELLRANEGGLIQVTNGDLDVSGDTIVGDNLDMTSGDIQNINQLANFFASACDPGQAVVDIDNSGDFQCMDVSEEVAGDYVNRSGDSMTGNLDMTGNNVLDVGDLTGNDIVDNAQISGSAVTSTELDETDIYSLDWSNLDGIDQSDVDVSDLGPADSNLDMNQQDVQNINQLASFFDSACDPGFLLADVNDDGSFNCQPVDEEAQDTFVERTGDSMNGTLDMGLNGNDDIINIGNLGGTDIVHTDNIASSQVTSNELDETDVYNLDWSNLAVEQTDVDVSDLGPADTNLDMNSWDIQNIGDLQGADIVNQDNINTGAVGLNELDTGDVDGRYVNRAGDTMNGNLEVNGNIIGTRLDLEDRSGDTSQWTLIEGSADGRLDIQSGGSSSLELYSGGDVEVSRGDLDLSNDNIRNINQLAGFFASACDPGEAVVDIDDSGNFQCMDVSSEVSGDYVNRSGDSMTGNLDMTGNNILDIGDLGGADIVNSGNINAGAVGSSEIASNSVGVTELDEGNVDGRYVQISGDAMTGSLDMNTNDLRSVRRLEGDTHELRFDSSNSWVEVTDSNGNRDDVVLGDVYIDDWAGGNWLSDTIDGRFVQRSGDSMDGDLSMNGNNINSPGLVDGVDVGSPGNALSVDGSNQYSVDSDSIGINELREGETDDRYYQLSGDRMEGHMDMDVYEIRNFFDSGCPDGQTVTQVNDDGSYQCMDVSGEVEGDYVNRDGDSMTGNLDMTGNNLQDVSEVNPAGETIRTGGDVNVGSGTVTSDQPMCIGDQC